ncbi:MAG: hypothetical protein HW375_2501 [Anaerolineales bacterium]|nr:hypothetical protein [Anaerolineales bacterium]
MSIQSHGRGRIEAVGTNGDGRLPGLAEHQQQLRAEADDPGKEGLGLRRDVAGDEEGIQVHLPPPHIVLVQMKNLDRLDLEAAGAGELQLEGNVGQVLRLDRGRALDLDQAPAAASPGENIDAGGETGVVG